MAFIPLPSGFRVAMEYTKDGQLVVNVYHVTSALPVNTTNLTALATIFRDWWINTMRSQTVDDQILNAVVATDISVQAGLQVTLPVTTNNAGLINAVSTPNNVAFVVTHLTGFSGRTRRGRTYLAGLSSVEVTDNDLLLSRATALVNGLGTLRTNLITGGWTPVVASYQINKAPRVTAEATPILVYAANTRVDTQRRRLPDEGA
jgi:hypothetical protein